MLQKGKECEQGCGSGQVKPCVPTVHTLPLMLNNMIYDYELQPRYSDRRDISVNDYTKITQ